MDKLKPYFKLIGLEATSPMNGGIWYYLSRYLIRFIRTLVLVGIWRVIYRESAVSTPIGLDQVLLYTLVAAVFWEQLDVRTTASTTFWEGTAFSRFLRPLNVFGQYMAETTGKWLPGLFIFSLPMVLVSPLLGINIVPEDWETTGWFGVSLAAGILTGFALDFILTGLMVYLDNAHYFAVQIRNALTSLLSGALIPLGLLPSGIGEILARLPFASLASAPLSIYTGTTENVIHTVLLQISWCLVLWLTAIYIWKRNRQRLVIFGG